MTVTEHLDREWQRFTPLKRLSRFAFYLFAVAALVVSLQTIDVIPEFLYDAPEQMADLFRRMWPLDPSYIQPDDQEPDRDPAHRHGGDDHGDRACSAGRAIGRAQRHAKSRPQSVCEIRFRDIAVDQLIGLGAVVRRGFGPGPLAGTFAIAFRSIGFTGKLFAEALEEANQGSIEALNAAGAPKLSTLLLGYWPQVRPAFWSIALFRWDINIRESAVLGLVGAGGIGVALDTALNLLYWDQVAVVLLAIFVVVILAEIIVTTVRAKVL